MVQRRGSYGTTYRELRTKLDLLGEAYGKAKAEAAQAHLLTYDGQFTATQKPLAEVKLRSDVRRYCWQLLGPPPEQWDQFYRHPDGTPMPEHAAKMASLGKKEEPTPRPSKRTRKQAS